MHQAKLRPKSQITLTKEIDGTVKYTKENVTT